MRYIKTLGTLALLTCGGCGSEGKEGDACEVMEDCGDDLHCHIEDGAGVCERDDDHDHAGH